LFNLTKAVRRCKDVVPGTQGISAHPVAQEALLPTGKEFCSLLIGKLKRFSEQTGPFLPIAQNPDQGDHHGLKIGDRHLSAPSLVEAPSLLSSDHEDSAMKRVQENTRNDHAT
jgi:hypothetical protein